ncbi:MAG TPA: hypothetical protein GXX77_03595 [Candidatus Cloacimonetes bacterium]|nr:hypothetical protein [Candidatus Cloacimonadota bacterium]
MSRNITPFSLFSTNQSKQGLYSPLTHFLPIDYSSAYAYDVLMAMTIS